MKFIKYITSLCVMINLLPDGKLELEDYYGISGTYK